MKTVLHAGCGNTRLPEWLDGKEVRLDIDPRVRPDIIASLTNLGEIGEFDVVYCCHCLEHLYSHDVSKALAEFRRVLKPGGAAMIRVPDLEDVRPTEDPVYESMIGPITGLDMYFGHRGLVEKSPFQAHHCGFTKPKMEQVLADAGFERFDVKRALDHFELFAVAVR